MFTERRTKARKRFACTGCLGFFAPGSVRWNLAGVSDGDFWSSKLCEECKDRHAEWSANASAGDGWGPGELREHRGDERGACSPWTLRSIYQRGTPICGTCGHLLPVKPTRWRDGQVDFHKCCHRPDPITIRQLWRLYRAAITDRNQNISPTSGL